MPTTGPWLRRRKLQPVHEEIRDLLLGREEDRFSCPKEARKKAMDFLARREYGRQELINKLLHRGFERDAVEQAVDQLGEDGLQSDQRFAENFVQSRVSRGKGPIRIRQELRERCIGDAAIDFAIENASADWHELAQEIRLKKFGPAKPRDFKAKAKQMRFLQYRGFEPAEVQAAVAEGDD